MRVCVIFPLYVTQPTKMICNVQVKFKTLKLRHRLEETLEFISAPKPDRLREGEMRGQNRRLQFCGVVKHACLPWVETRFAEKKGSIG